MIDNLLKEIRSGTTLRPTQRKSVRRVPQLSGKDLEQFKQIAASVVENAATPPVQPVEGDRGGGAENTSASGDKSEQIASPPRDKSEQIASPPQDKIASSPEDISEKIVNGPSVKGNSSLSNGTPTAVGKSGDKPHPLNESHKPHPPNVVVKPSLEGVANNGALGSKVTQNGVDEGPERGEEGVREMGGVEMAASGTGGAEGGERDQERAEGSLSPIERHLHDSSPGQQNVSITYNLVI